jgi:hypothetical protein
MKGERGMKILVVVLTAMLSLGGGTGRTDVSEKEDIRRTLQSSVGGPEMLFETLNGDIRILRTHN